MSKLVEAMNAYSALTPTRLRKALETGALGDKPMADPVCVLLEGDDPHLFVEANLTDVWFVHRLDGVTVPIHEWHDLLLYRKVMGGCHDTRKPGFSFDETTREWVATPEALIALLKEIEREDSFWNFITSAVRRLRFWK